MTVPSLAFTAMYYFSPLTVGQSTQAHLRWKKKTNQTKTMEKRHSGLTAEYINQGYHYALTQGAPC